MASTGCWVCRCLRRNDQIKEMCCRCFLKVAIEMAEWPDCYITNIPGVARPSGATAPRWRQKYGRVVSDIITTWSYQQFWMAVCRVVHASKNRQRDARLHKQIPPPPAARRAVDNFSSSTHMRVKYLQYCHINSTKLCKFSVSQLPS